MQTKRLKFIADANVEKPLVDFLTQAGIDVKWVPQIDQHMSNGYLLEISEKENRILITNDKDFGTIVFRQKRPSYGIILFRVKGQSASEKIRLIEKLLTDYPDKIENHFVVATKAKIRFILLKEVVP